MNISNLQPASKLAGRYGCKAIIYGQPGSGKTPLINTAPRPVLLATEPGLLSMRDSTVPTWDAFTRPRAEEFFKWLFESKEASNFDTIAVDSGSQLAEISLMHWQKTCKDGRKAFGEMSQECMGYFDGMFFMPNKHIVLICKQMQAETGSSVVNQGGAFVVQTSYQSQPFFPGKDLNIKVPHRYDMILHMCKVQIPGHGEQRALRTKGSNDVLARDRSGLLAEFEPPDLTALFSKAMG